MTPPNGPRTVDTTSVSARVSQAVMAVVIAVISVLFLITTHRMRLDLGPVQVPTGLLLGLLFQVTACVFLVASTGARLPLLLLGSLWGLIAGPFLGRGAGGGVLVPAVVAEQTQYAGWIVQGIGILVPFAAALMVTLRRRRR